MTPSADVAHHRTQHALNKPSNPKTPQGTILSAPLPPHAHPVDADRIIRRQNFSQPSFAVML